MDDAPLHLVVPAHLAGERLDRALAALVPGESVARLQKLVRRGAVQVDGRVVTRSNVSVQRDARLTLQVPARAAAEALLRVLHEDDDIVVVVKPAGIVTHPTERIVGGTLAELCDARFGPLSRRGGAERPGIVHRLDRETSGVLVLAKTDAAHAALQDQFRAREVDKRYEALVLGALPAERWEVDEPLAAAPGERDRQRVDHDGKPARTTFEQRASRGGLHLLECRPTTGRRHQVRVHLFTRGLQLVGEPIYRVTPALPLDASAPRPARQALHAASLAFRHPSSGARVRYRAGLPPDLARLAAWVRASS